LAISATNIAGGRLSYPYTGCIKGTLGSLVHSVPSW